MVNISGVLPEEVRNVWHHYESYLRSACLKDIENRLSLSGLREACISGSSILVEISDKGRPIGAAVVCRSDIKAGRHLFVQVLGGDNMRAWLSDFVEALERIALNTQCTDGILFCGRPGWDKSLLKHGFKTILVTMRKEVIK